jgi:hypothetical protein
VSGRNPGLRPEKYFLVVFLYLDRWEKVLEIDCKFAWKNIINIFRISGIRMGCEEPLARHREAVAVNN